MNKNITLEKAKIGLILSEPFFANCALRMEYVEDLTIETGSTNGKLIKYNPAFINKLGVEMTKTFIAHEILHTLAFHTTREQGKNHETWNKACDYAINPLLKQSGFKMTENWLFKPEFQGMSAEEIYVVLMKEKEEKEQEQSNGTSPQNPKTEGKNESQNFGEVEAPPEEVDVKEMEQEIRQMAVQAGNAAKQAGKGVCEGLKELIQELVEPKQNWKEILNRFICEVVRNDYTWSKPNHRYLPMGLYLPKLESLEIGKVVFAIDTSSSIDRELLQVFVSELKDASSLFSVPITVIHCDTKVRKVEQMEEDGDIVPEGRGGTEFQPVFDYVAENVEDCKAIVYLTDGGSWGKYTEPDCPVIWCIYANRHFKCDFGEIINID